MPAITGLDHFTIVCRDLDESIRFYTEVLGATIERPKRVTTSVGSPGGFSPVGIMMGGIRVDLFQADADWQPYPGTWAQHYAFPIQWEDVDAWFTHMQSHGVRLAIHPAGDRTISLYFSDPTGYHFELNLRSNQPEFVQRETERLLEKYGNPYFWADGPGVPEGQPAGQWASPAHVG
jgi:catechol 2,3-dioxygenase-like lactoylglutathione lyase family enzyme